MRRTSFLLSMRLLRASLEHAFSHKRLLADFLAGKRERRSLVVFEQSVTPKGVPPRLRGLARRIAAGAMKTTLDDLDAEAARIQKGQSRLPDLNRFAERSQAQASRGGAHSDQHGHTCKDSKQHQKAYCKAGRDNPVAASSAGSLTAAASRSRGIGLFALGSRTWQDLQRCCAEGSGLWQASLANRVVL
jgi:hypothetical protein